MEGPAHFIRTWEACRQDAEGCYYTAACKEPAIGAHVVSRSWLQTLASQGKVYWFSRSKGAPKWLYQALKNVDGVSASQGDHQPSLVPIGLAASSGFCCLKHDGEFRCIDNRDNLNLKGPKDRHLNLMFYRAMLRQLYIDTALKSLRGLYPVLNANYVKSHPIEADSVADLQQSRKVLLEALGAKSSWRVKHLVRHIPGPPRLAAAVAATWKPAEGFVKVADLKSTGAWGCTVIPLEGGHLVAYHYCTTLRKGPRAKKDLAWKKNWLSTNLIQDDAKLPYRVSLDLLDLCEELCITPPAWDTRSASEQKAIRDVFTVSIDSLSSPFQGISRIHSPTEEINLFA